MIPRLTCDSDFIFIFSAHDILTYNQEMYIDVNIHDIGNISLGTG